MVFSKNTSFFFWSVLGWALLLLRHGYTFGTGDHSEILPYIENLNNPVLYSNDFYVTHIISIVPNVRWFFAECALFFVGNLSSWFFVFHAFSTIFLLMGTMKVCHKLSVSIPFSFLGIMGYLLLFYGKIPGGNEWYLNNFQAESMAFVLGIWSIYWALENKQWLGFGALVLATLFHPLAGIQFALLIAASLLFTKQLNWKALLVFLSLGGTYFILIFLNHQSNLDTNLLLPNFFDLLFVFRQPHHSLPSSFSLIGSIITLILFIVTLVAVSKKSKVMFYYFGFIGIGCIVYVFGTLLFKSVLIAQTQWFKTVAIVTVIGGAMAIDGIFSFMPQLKRKLLGISKLEPILGLAAAIIVALLLSFPQANLLQKPFLFGNAQNKSELILISEAIAQKIPPDAIFIQPFDADAFHYYSKHPSYVSFKAVVHHKTFMYEWYKRIQQVYGVSLAQQGGFSLTELANANYEKLLKEGNINWDVNYALVKKGKYFYPTVLSNSHYQVLLIHPPN